MRKMFTKLFGLTLLMYLVSSLTVVKAQCNLAITEGDVVLLTDITTKCDSDLIQYAVTGFPDSTYFNFNSIAGDSTAAGFTLDSTIWVTEGTGFTVQVRYNDTCLSNVLTYGGDDLILPVYIDTLLVTQPLCADDKGELTVVVGGTEDFLVNFVDSAAWYAGGKESGTYTWYNGTQFQAVPGKEYFVRVKSANDCTSLGWDSISVASAPSQLTIDDVTASVDTVACIGDSATVTVLNVAGGTAPYYVTVGGQTDTLATAGTTTFDVPAGTYTATVVDANGCSVVSDSSAVIVNPAIVTFDISIDDVTCDSTATGTIYVHDFDGGSGTGFQASIGDGNWVAAVNDTVALTGLYAGYYSVFVMDGNSCDSVGYVNPNNTQNTISVQSPGGIEYDVVIDTVVCYGDSSVITIASVDGGSGAYEYSIDGGSSWGDDYSWTVPAGTYNVVVRDADATSCEIAWPAITLTNPDQVVIDNVATVSPTCPGGNDGVINITATAEAGRTLQYSINGTSWYTNHIFAVAPGNYTVRVRDMICPETVVTDNVTVDALSDNEIAVYARDTFVNCYGDDDGYVYLAQVSWADQTGSDNRVVSYYMTTDEDELYVSGDSTTDGMYEDLAPGTYYFWAEDNLGCQSENTLTVIVTEAEELTISGSVTNEATCYDANDGVMTIIAGTGTPTSYAHANTLQAAMALASGAYTTWPSDTNMVNIQVGKGTYYVVAKDDCGDKAYAGPFTVDGYDELVMPDTALVIVNNTCAGDSAGWFTIAPATGGSAPENIVYTLTHWGEVVGEYDSVATTTFTGLPHGRYRLTAYDLEGCEGDDMIVYITSPDPLYRYDAFENDISCYGAADGTIGIWLEGGTPPYQFKIGTAGWRDFPESGWEGNPTQEIVITEPGTYTVWVRDSLGCLSVDGPYTYTIAEPDPIVITVDVTNVTNTCDADNGELEISASGGWDAVLGTDFSIFVNGVEEGSHMDSGEVVIVTGLAAGEYVIDVVENHAYGCEVSETVIITAPDTVFATAEVTADVSCNGGDNGEITVSDMSGGTVYSSGIYNVTISPAIGVKDTVEGNIVFSELTADTFDITVTDSLGCSYVINNVVVTEPTALTLNATHIADITCVSDGSFSVQATGGAGDYKYFAALSILPQHVLIPDPASPAWQDDSVFTVSAPGTYIVWAMDANECVIGGEENDLGFAVNAWRVKMLEPEVVVTVDASAYMDEVLCNGDLTDTITLDAVTIEEDGVELVDPEYTVTINGFATDTLTGVGAGTYVVMVTHESGCYGTDTVVVTEPEVLEVTLNVGDGEFSCPDVTEGYIEAVATGGTPWGSGPSMDAELKSAGSTKGYSDYEFQLWQDGVLKTDYIDIDAFLVKVGHTYQVVAMDANGCTDTSNVIVIDPVAPVVITAIEDVTCSSDTLGSVEVSVTGEAGREFVVYYDQIESDSPSDSGSVVVPASGTVKLDQVLMFDNENIDDIHYAIWVVDNMGCVSEIDTITIDQIITSPLELVATEGDMVGCQTEVTVSVGGGVGPYVITVDGVEVAAGTVLLGGGTHVIEATDAHSCVVSQEMQIAYGTSLDTTITIYEGETADFVYETIDTMLVGGTYSFYYDIDTVCVGEVNVEVIEIPKVAPVVVSMSPTDTIADNHPDFVLTFNTGVSLGDGGQLTVTPLDGTTPTLVLDLTEAMFSDSTITVTYDWTVSGSLDLNTTYVVTVDSAAVMGQGIVWEGISDDSWQFTTGDTFATPAPIIEVANFKVYPNPFNDRIYVDNYDKLNRVIVSNIAGQRVLDIENPTYEIRTGNLVTGVYVVTLISDGEIVKSERIIKR